MQQDEFASAIQQVFRQAVEQADKIRDQANQLKAEALLELDKAKAIHLEAEKAADGLMASYFEERQAQFREAAQTELLRQLTRKHLESGKLPEEISAWLGVTPQFTQQVAKILNRLKNRPMDQYRMHDAIQISYSGSGRGGTIVVQNPATRFELWWEFAGGDALVILDIPSENDWTKRTGLPLAERPGLLAFIGEKVLADKVSGDGSYVIGENVITFYANR